MTLQLSDKKWTHERQAYSLMTMLGDLGGFNSIVYILPSFVMGYFSQHIFKWTVANGYPVKIVKKRKGQ